MGMVLGLGLGSEFGSWDLCALRGGFHVCGFSFGLVFRFGLWDLLMWG